MAANSQFVMATHICVAIGYIEKHHSTTDTSKKFLVKSNVVAGSVNTNPGLIRRIISQLVQANLIESFEGKFGGLKLACPPEEISLWQIYSAIGEQNFFALNPNSPNKKCPISRNIVNLVEKIFDEVDAQVKAKLESVTIADFIFKIEKKEQKIK